MRLGEERNTTTYRVWCKRGVVPGVGPRLFVCDFRVSDILHASVVGFVVGESRAGEVHDLLMLALGGGLEAGHIGVRVDVHDVDVTLGVGDGEPLAAVGYGNVGR